MSGNLEERIVSFLSTHAVLNLATVAEDARPIVSSMGYANDGATVFFITGASTRKYRNIQKNAAVAYTVDDPHPQWSSLSGIQMEGTAVIVTDSEEQKKIRDLLGVKFPPMKDLPVTPNTVFIKVEPVECYFLDYSQGFGHRDHMVF